jgi:CRISPR-associated endonuclease/helicase Cas3
MSRPTPEQFADFYRAVHGFDPFPWQKRLSKRVCEGSWPRAIALPTAAGKTASIDIAVFALACGAQNAARRIFFVVDRRIVVDQAFEHAKDLATKLCDAESGILKDVADSLRSIAQDKRPLDVYALRGGMYRETAWARSPLQPAVIASTVDQVGSRLLFRGYGVSDSMKPIHAGLVGNDSIILLDEAHCAKPFDQTAQAIKSYREWNANPEPFHFVSITATPGKGLDKEEANADDLNDPVLGARINASKPARLVVATKATGKRGYIELAKVLAEQAKLLVADTECVGIIVNRVATARELKKLLGEDAVLLTGRMRPLDRDNLFKDKLKPLLSNSKLTQAPPKFVIGTQCLEVGADFDFYALVTECASLDALRQRFGRLNRVAKRPLAHAVIVIRGDEIEDTSEDPVYGASLAETWKFLNQHAPEGTFDFGVAAVRTIVDGLDLSPYNAPSLDAPALFPTHLDCWVQTNPIPIPDPDPALFLHGPSSGQPDVQVVFRDDLGEKPDDWYRIVELCPPSSSEAVPVRIGTFKKWLAGESVVDQTSDVEGESELDEEPKPKQSRTALLWRGPNKKDKPKKSYTVEQPSDVLPSGVYVIPCTAEDTTNLGDFPYGLTDYSEPAFQRSRDKALLRGVQVDVDEEHEEFEDRLTLAIQARMIENPEKWLKTAVEFLVKKRNRTVEKHPLRGWVVTGKKRLHQYDPEFLDAETSSYSPGRPIPLDVHSRGVAALARRFAEGCRLETDRFEQAGLYHDLGKLDPRFQKLLKGYAGGEPLAKSGSNVKREWSVHMYPRGSRHELLSAAILQTQTSDELLLHLVATHHGSARPFADTVEENSAAMPIDVKALGLKTVSSRQEIAEWNAELPERFWRMVREYGWWGLAFRETVFRLADHGQSAAEQEDDFEIPPVVKFAPMAAAVVREPRHTLALTGLDGSNPLAFLAALGAFRLASRVWPEARLAWRFEAYWHAVIELPILATEDELVAALMSVGCVNRQCLTFSDDLKIDSIDFRSHQDQSIQTAKVDREFADFLRAFADPLVTVQAGPNAGRTKPTEFYFIAGQQRLIEQARRIVATATDTHISTSLFKMWQYEDPVEGSSLRWDPLDDFRYAVRFVNPSKDRMKGKRGSMLGANRLAFEALPFFPCFPSGARLSTTGFTVIDRRPFFSWPVWSPFLSADTVRSYLSSVDKPKPKTDQVQPLVAICSSQWYQSEKVANSDYSNFSPSRIVSSA